MSEIDELNRAYWDNITPIHVASNYYEYEKFRSGQSTLKVVEDTEVGDVAGKSLLHLQCHFGLHTLSWARKGAIVTGVDYSEQAIASARDIRDTVGLEADFLCCNVYDLPENLHRNFDIVFTSYGVLYCLPDLARWAKVAAHFLKPGGVFYICELHPVFYMLDDAGERIVHPYFHEPAGTRVEAKPVLVEPDAEFAEQFHQWTHSLSDVINAVIGSGLRIDYVHEHPFITLNARDYLEYAEPGTYRIRGRDHQPPMLFSLRAHREG